MQMVMIMVKFTWYPTFSNNFFREGLVSNCKFFYFLRVFFLYLTDSGDDLSINNSETIPIRKKVHNPNNKRSNNPNNKAHHTNYGSIP